MKQGWYEDDQCIIQTQHKAWINPEASGGAKSESKLRLEKNAEGNKRDR